LEYHITCENALEVFGFLSNGEVLDQQLNSTEEDEVAEDRAALLDPVKGIKVARNTCSKLILRAV